MATSDTLTRAIGFYRAGMLDRADALCKAMIDAKPDDFDALDLLALIQCRRGHWRDALASYNNLLAINLTTPWRWATAATSCTSYIARKTRWQVTIRR